VLIAEPLIDSGVDGVTLAYDRVAVTGLVILMFQGAYTTKVLNVTLLTELYDPHKAWVTATKLLEGSDLNQGAI
jgi:hypothetical protein